MELKIQKFINPRELRVTVDVLEQSNIKKTVQNDGYYINIYDCGLVRYGYKKNEEFWSSSLSKIKKVFPEYSFFDAEVSVEYGNTIYAGFALLNTDELYKQVRGMLWQRKADIAWNMQLCEVIIESYSKHHDQLLKDCEESGFEVLSWSYGSYRIGFKKSDLKEFVKFLDKSYIWKWSFQ